MSTGITNDLLGLTRVKTIPSSVTTAANVAAKTAKIAAPIGAAAALGVYTDRWLDQRTHGPTDKGRGETAAFFAVPGTVATALCSALARDTSLSAGARRFHKYTAISSGLIAVTAGAAILHNALTP